MNTKSPDCAASVGIKFSPKTKPYKHQQEFFDRFKDDDYFAILAEMGTGKSKMVIDVIAYQHLLSKLDRVLLIAPVSVGPQWLEEQIPFHCPVPYSAFLYRSDSSAKYKLLQKKFLADSKMNNKLLFLIMNPEAFVGGKGNKIAKEFFLTSKKRQAIVIDEASRIKNPDAKSVVWINKLRDNFPDSLRVIMTGTPAAKSPVDTWSMFDFLKRGYMGCSYLAFKHRHEVMFNRKVEVKNRTYTIRTAIDERGYAIIQRAINNSEKTEFMMYEIMNKYGLTLEDYKTIAENKQFVRFKHVEELQKKIAAHSFSVAKRDCLDLPEKIYQVIKLPMNPEQVKHIKQLAEYSATVHEDDYLTISTKALLGIRVLQICGGNLPVHAEKDGDYTTIPIKGPNAKLNYILGDLDEAGGQQCIVWAVFKAEVDMLHFELSKRHAVVAMHGDTPKKAREEAIRRFKSGEAQILVSHPEVGGYGLNLHFAELQYWYSRSYRTEARLQAEDRSHRIGTVRSPVYKDLVYNSKFERNVLEVLKEGTDMNSKFVNVQLNDIFKLE